MTRKEFRDLASPEKAHAAVAGLDLSPGTERVPLPEARGRVLAERIDAELDVPGFDRASMDGYAVRARDTFGADEADPAVLDLVGEVHAGEKPDVTVEPGTCAEISTGAVMPDGADAVVIVERTDRLDPDSTERAGGAERGSADQSGERGEGNQGTPEATRNPQGGGEAATRVEIRTSVAPGDSVMLAGADIAAGARAMGPGTLLTPREIGLLSALGVEEVPVRGRPTVGIVSTGDELVRPGGELDSEAGQIYDVNSYTIATGVEEAGGVARLYPHAGDDYEGMGRLLVEAAADCDLVLSSGSTSASAVDVIYRVIEERGELLLHGVAVKPGKPMLVGRIDAPEGGEGGADERELADADTGAGTDGGGGASAYVGLPGYPVSALTIFRTFVAPALRRAAGVPEPRTATVDGRMAVRERYSEGRLRFMPVGLVESGPSEEGRTEDSSEAQDASTDSSGRRSRERNEEEHGTPEAARSPQEDVAGEAGETLVYPVDKGSGATTSLVEADGVVEVHPDTEYLAEGETVEVKLFSPDVRPPTLLGVGEDDPALSRLLDRLDRPRYLPVGSREGLRRLRDGVPDVAVTAGPVERDVDAVELGRWRREWGLVVPAGNPGGVEGVADLVDRDLRFINRDSNSGVRTSLGDAVAALAEERGTTRRELAASIDGFELSVKAYESPARAVAADKADAGVGLRTSAEKLGLGFVPLGTQEVVVRANPARVGKVGVTALEAALSDVGDALDGLAGYETR